MVVERPPLVLVSLIVDVACLKPLVRKAASPIVFTRFGMPAVRAVVLVQGEPRFFSSLQSQNAYFPIDKSLPEGAMVRAVSFSHFANA